MENTFTSTGEKNNFHVLCTVRCREVRRVSVVRVFCFGSHLSHGEKFKRGKSDKNRVKYRTEQMNLKKLTKRSTFSEEIFNFQDSKMASRLWGSRNGKAIDNSFTSVCAERSGPEYSANVLNLKVH